MAKAMTLRRPGVERIFRKTPFRKWLDEQPRADLTYDKMIQRVDDNGWTAEDFAMEARHRGVETRVQTVHKWSGGSQPRFMTLHALRKAFPEIAF